MTYNKEQRRNYYKHYFRNNPMQSEKNKERMKLRYWRRKYIESFYCSFVDIEKLTVDELKEDIKKGMSRV